MQDRRFQQFDVALFTQLPRQRGHQGFAGLDTAARQVPSGDVTVFDQKHPALWIQNDAAHPEREAAQNRQNRCKSRRIAGSNGRRMASKSMAIVHPSFSWQYSLEFF